MSGGHFDYIQHKVSDVAVEIIETIEEAKTTWTQAPTDATITAMEINARIVQIVGTIIHDTDYFISGDIGEGHFVLRTLCQWGQLAGLLDGLVPTVEAIPIADEEWKQYVAGIVSQYHKERSEGEKS